MSTVGVRDLSDQELRKRLLSLGYDVPVSVNREFLVKKLENASAAAVGGGGGKPNKARHSVAVTPAPSTPQMGNPSPARKRKSMAVTPSRDARSGNRGQQQNDDGEGNHSQNSHVYRPTSPTMSQAEIDAIYAMAASRGQSGGEMNYNQNTPTYNPTSPSYTPTGIITYPSPSGMSSIATPSTPSPFVSRLSTPSNSPSPTLPNGETANHSPRYMNYYNMFKNTPTMMGEAGGGHNYPYNRSIRLSAPPGGSPVTSVAPPSKSDRNGYATGGGYGTESDWCGGTFVSKVLVGLFVLFFVIIGGLYVSKSFEGSFKGLPGEVTTDVGLGKRQESQKPPPVRKQPLLPSTKMHYPICGLEGVDPNVSLYRFKDYDYLKMK